MPLNTIFKQFYECRLEIIICLCYSVTHNPTQVQQILGYCPQFDAIDPLLTVMEHLMYYARIRGVPSQHVRVIMHLHQYTNRACQQHSHCETLHSNFQKYLVKFLYAIVD